MNKIQEVMHRFRSGGMERKDGSQEGAQPSRLFSFASFQTRRGTSEGAIHTISSGPLTGEGSTQWYVDPPLPTTTTTSPPVNTTSAPVNTTAIPGNTTLPGNVSINTTPSPGKSNSLPRKTTSLRGSSHSRTNSLPGQIGNLPAKTSSLPGQIGNLPAKTSSLPAKTSNSGRTDKGELSSLPIITPSGLQQTMLAALGRSDPIPIITAVNNRAVVQQPSSPDRKLSRTQPKGTLEYKDGMLAHWRSIRSTPHQSGPSQEGDPRLMPQSPRMIPMRRRGPEVHATQGLTQAVCTVQVMKGDTLEKIAARLEVTPSELKKLNRMSSRMVFENQILFIPDPDYVPSEPSTPEVGSPVSPVDVRPKFDIPIVKMADKPPSRVPGRVLKIPSPPVSVSPVREATPPLPRVLSEDEARRLDEQCSERFIKVCAQLISEGFDKIPGTLLVTPNAIMFDPDVVQNSDNVDLYSMVVYMDTIISAALYHDLCAMEYHSQHRSKQEAQKKPEVYHGSSRMPSTSSVSKSPSALADDSFEFIPDHHRMSAGRVVHIPKGASSGEIITNVGSAGVTTLFQRTSMIEVVGEVAHYEVVEKIDLGDVIGETSTDDVIPVPVMSDRGNSQIRESSKSGSTIPQEAVHQGGNPFSTDRLSERQDMNPRDRQGTGSGHKQHAERRQETLLTKHQSQTGVQESLTSGQRDSHAGWDTTAPSHPRAGDNLGTDPDLSKAVGSQTISNAVAEECANNLVPEILQSVSVSMGLDSAHALNWGTAAPKIEKEKAVATQGQGDEGKQVDGKEHLQSVDKQSQGNSNITTNVVNSDSIPKTEIKADNCELPSSAKSELSTTSSSKEDNSSRKQSESSSITSPSSSTQPSSNIPDYDPNSFHSSYDDDANVRKYHDVPVVQMKQSTGERTNCEEAGKVTGAGTEGSPQVMVKSAVKAEERPELFRQVSDLIPQQEDVHSQPAIYLHLQVDRGECDRRVTSSIPSESYRHQKTKPHYWFSFPRHKADHLYAFFVQWRPELYGEETYDPLRQGFVVVDEDDEFQENSEDLSFVDDYFGQISNTIRKDWELISREEALRRGSLLMAQIYVPELLESSAILTTQNQLLQVSESLPAVTVGCQWQLVYSTSKHGYSLKRLYRESVSITSPVLLVIQDADNTIFGAYLSHTPRCSDHFFGNGTCKLWTFKDKFQCFEWSRENELFIKGDEASLSVGASKGVYGLWLDDSLDRGRSRPCATFNNMVLSAREDFHIQILEVWTFV